MSLWKFMIIGFIYSVEIGLGYSNIGALSLQNYQIKGNGETVDLRLYYECLCPYSIDFHTGLFKDTVAKLASYLVIKTYPYGNAKTTTENGKTVVKCQHGPEECYGNKLHACAIDILKNNTQSVFYNACLMSGQSTDEDATNCGASMGVDAKYIIECAKGEKGEQLLEYYGEETLKDVPDKKGVPWPLVNGNFVESQPNFTAIVCAAFAHPPPQCQ